MTAQTVPIADIIIPEIRSNAVYSPEKFEELKTSIASSGIQFRPTVRPVAGGKFELVDGRHRVAVWHDLGHPDIEVEVETLTDEQAYIKHITANHHRGESDPVGLSKVIRILRDGGKTLEEVGKMIGYSASTAAQYETLAFLPDVYQAAVSAGALKLVHVREAARLEDPRDVDAALGYALQLKWSGETMHHYVQNRIEELAQVQAKAAAQHSSAIAPPPPSPSLAQYRTCLVCGAQGQAETMFYPVLGKECHDALNYLLEIDPNPWNAVGRLVSEIQGAQAEIEKRDLKIKELSDRIIELSLKLIPAAPPNPQPAPVPYPTVQWGAPKPGTPLPAQNPAP